MKKATIIAHRHDQAKIVDQLQQAGMIEIVPLQEPPLEGAEQKLFAKRAEQLELELTKVQFVREFLKRAEPPKGGLVSSLIKDRVLINRARFQGIDKKIDFEKLYVRCEELDEKLAAADRELINLESEKAGLSGWLGLDVSFDELTPTDSLGLAAGRVKRSKLDGLAQALEHACPESAVVFTSPDGPVAHLVVLYYGPHKAAVQRALASNGFEFVGLEGWRDTPQEELEKIDHRILAIDLERRAITDEIAGLLPLLSDVKILEDWLSNRRQRYLVQAKFSRTPATFLLQGWIEAEQTGPLAERLEQEAAVVDFSFAGPEAGDKPPTRLKNPGWLKPFETLTRLYGMPNYHELDPTPIMGVFFFLFFGICLGDFGYGLVLALFCLVLKRRLILTEPGKQWLNLFALGGLASMLVGIPTGSYFGLEISMLPSFLRGLVVLDPLKQAFVFLMATWALGAVHVIIGMMMELWDAWRQGRYSEAVYSNLTQLAVVLTATATAVGWLATTVFESRSPVFGSLLTAGVKLLGLAAIVYVLFSGGFFTGYLEAARRAFGRGAKVPARANGDIIALLVLTVVLTGWLVPVPGLPRPSVMLTAVILGLAFSSTVRQAMANLGVGFYNLYGMSGFLGDVLSYSRLMALGLATLLIGFVINTLAGLVIGAEVFGLPIGILLAIVIAVPLHAVNLIINLLGAFVHPLRLQFVEFFSKFYENGGQAFRPFAFETEHLIFKEE